MSRCRLTAFYCLILVAALLFSCGAEISQPRPSVKNESFEPHESLSFDGAVAVLSRKSNAVVIFDDNGNFEQLSFHLPFEKGKLANLAWDHHEQEILVTVNEPATVWAVHPQSRKSRIRIGASQLQERVDAIVALLNGEILLAQDKNQKMPAQSLFLRDKEAWGSCRDNRIQLYNSHGDKQQSLEFKEPPSSCLQLADGRYAIAFAESAEIQIYSADLKRLVWRYKNADELLKPQGIAQNLEGHLLISDSRSHHVVELSLDKKIRHLYGRAFLREPSAITLIQRRD